MAVAARKSDAVTAALELFWSKGYAETSMAELVEATGMNRYALYSVFGNKREIFLAALEAYFEEGRQTFEPILYNTELAPLERIETGMRTFIAMLREKQNGCFICHVAVEHRSDDPEVDKAVNAYFNRIRELIRAPLEEAAARGELNPNLPPDCAAQLVFDAEMSLGVHVRAGAPEADLEKIIRATLAALRVPETVA
ncbi:MAG: TetR/AcrR family transcriptional regulator [Pseudomonadota bacterium]